MDNTMTLKKLTDTFALLIPYGLLLGLLYYPSYTVMFKWWQRDDYSYCFLVPVLVLYMLWERWQTLTATPSRPSWYGMAPLLLGIALYWLGELGGEYFTLYTSSWFLLIGLCWLHLGWNKLKIIGFPLCLILAMFPPPNFIGTKITVSLKLLSSQLGVSILQFFGMTAYRDGNIIDLGFTQLQVVDACSGLRYFFPLIIMGLLLAYFFKAQLWKRVLVVLTTVPLSVGTNGLRIASVGFLYPYFGVAVAEGFFHDFSGFVMFMLAVGLLLLEIALLKRIWPRAEEKWASFTPPLSTAPGAVSTPPSGREGFAWLRQPSFWVALFCLGATLGLSRGIEFREKVPIAKSFSSFPLQIGQWSGTSMALEPEILKALYFSDYIVVNYQNDQRQQINFYTAYYESQRKGEAIHSPDTCLPSSGWIYNQSGTTTFPLAGTAITVNRAVMEKGGAKQIVYYWLPQQGRILTNLYQLKLNTFWNSLTKQRTDGALVRIITPVTGSEEEADKRLQQFAAETIPILNTFLPQ